MDLRASYQRIFTTTLEIWIISQSEVSFHPYYRELEDSHQTSSPIQVAVDLETKLEAQTDIIIFTQCKQGWFDFVIYKA